MNKYYKTEVDMELIKAKNLILAYNGFVAARDVNFTLKRGDYLCIIGENGSGKSTLLKAITGEVTHSGGELSINREVLGGGIGYLPQQSKIQKDFPATVREVVMSGCVREDGIGIFWKIKTVKKAENAMSLLGISDLSDRVFSTLSGGQRQRVLLARALCVSDTLLLLDEPMTGLDPDAAHDMYSAIRMLNREKGCAIVMVTHDVRCALHEADHVLSMCRGHSFFGTVEEYLEHERHDSELDKNRHTHGDHNHCCE